MLYIYIYIFIRIIIIIIIITSSSDPHHDIISFIYSDIFFWHFIWHVYSDILSGVLSGILSDISLLTFYLHCMWHLALAIEVPQCPLRSGSRSWGPAVPTELWHSRLRVGQRPLTSGTRCWGPAVPTWDLELAVDAEGGRGSRRRQAEAGGGGQHFWKNLGTWQVGNYWWFIPSNQD